MFQNNRIEHYLSLRDKAEDLSTWAAGAGVFLLIAFVAASLFVALLFLSSGKNSKRKMGTGICGMVLLVTWIALFGMIIERENQRSWNESVEKGLTKAYKETVVSNFHVDEEAVREAELDESDPKAGPKIKVEHIDLDSKTHYNLVFIFDKDTHEPILLESENVTEEVIEKLSRDGRDAEPAEID